eukprot:COSAG01_NODE_7137_length_3335_cov_3.540482_4_plen_244_part_01
MTAFSHTMMSAGGLSCARSCAPAAAACHRAVRCAPPMTMAMTMATADLISRELCNVNGCYPDAWNATSSSCRCLPAYAGKFCERCAPHFSSPDCAAEVETHCHGDPRRAPPGSGEGGGADADRHADVHDCCCDALKPRDVCQPASQPASQLAQEHACTAPPPPPPPLVETQLSSAAPHGSWPAGQLHACRDPTPPNHNLTAPPAGLRCHAVPCRAVLWPLGRGVRPPAAPYAGCVSDPDQVEHT